MSQQPRTLEQALASVRKKTETKNPAIGLAVRRAAAQGYLATLVILLQTDPAALNQLGSSGKAALHYALEKHQPIAVIRFLVEAGANMQARSGADGPLPVALADYDCGIQEYLSAKMAVASVVTQSLQSPMVIHKPAPPPDDTNLAIRKAAAAGNLNAIALLLKRPGADINASGASGKTALHFAIIRGQGIGVVKALVEIHHADCTRPCADGKRPVQYCLPSNPVFLYLVHRRYSEEELYHLQHIRDYVTRLQCLGTSLGKNPYNKMIQPHSGGAPKHFEQVLMQKFLPYLECIKERAKLFGDKKPFRVISLESGVCREWYFLCMLMEILGAPIEFYAVDVRGPSNQSSQKILKRVEAFAPQKFTHTVYTHLLSTQEKLIALNGIDLNSFDLVLMRNPSFNLRHFEVGLTLITEIAPNLLRRGGHVLLTNTQVWEVNETYQAIGYCWPYYEPVAGFELSIGQLQLSSTPTIADQFPTCFKFKDDGLEARVIPETKKRISEHTKAQVKKYEYLYALRAEHPNWLECYETIYIKKDVASGKLSTIVKQILAELKLSFSDDNIALAFRICAAKDCFAQMYILHRYCPKVLNSAGKTSKKTALHFVFERQKINAFDCLLRLGADMTALDAKNRAPLACAPKESAVTEKFVRFTFQAQFHAASVGPVVSGSDIKP